MQDLQHHLNTWDQKAQRAANSCPVKQLKVLPSTPPIAPGEKWLQTRGLWYLLTHKEGRVIRRLLFKHPFKYLWRYCKALFCRARQDGDFHLYGLKNIDQWKEQSSKSHVVIGFSYCEKPFECPDGRFSDRCRADDHPVCQQCPIGKIRSLIPNNRDIDLLLIRTVHDIGTFLFQLRDRHPKKDVLFLITACEITLVMFQKWAATLNLQGIGVQLQGRVCNTFRAFELSERGIKPGLTCVVSQTREKMYDLMVHLHTHTREDV